MSSASNSSCTFGEGKELPKTLQADNLLSHKEILIEAAVQELLPIIQEHRASVVQRQQLLHLLNEVRTSVPQQSY